MRAPGSIGALTSKLKTRALSTEWRRYLTYLCRPTVPYRIWARIWTPLVETGSIDFILCLQLDGEVLVRYHETYRTEVSESLGEVIRRFILRPEKTLDWWGNCFNFLREHDLTPFLKSSLDSVCKVMRVSFMHYDPSDRNIVSTNEPPSQFTNFMNSTRPYYSKSTYQL